MNKILITVYIVSIDEYYDLFLPINKRIADLFDLIQDSLIDLSNGNYQKKESILLYDADGLIINPNNYVKYSGLKNGSKVSIV